MSKVRQVAKSKGTQTMGRQLVGGATCLLLALGCVACFQMYSPEEGLLAIKQHCGDMNLPIWYHASDHEIQQEGFRRKQQHKSIMVEQLAADYQAGERCGVQLPRKEAYTFHERRAEIATLIMETDPNATHPYIADAKALLDHNDPHEFSTALRLLRYARDLESVHIMEQAVYAGGVNSDFAMYSLVHMAQQSPPVSGDSREYYDEAWAVLSQICNDEGMRRRNQQHCKSMGHLDGAE